MNVTITYRNGSYCGPDEYTNWTEVIHLNETDTLAEVFEKHFADKWTGNVNVELHFNVLSE